MNTFSNEINRRRMKTETESDSDDGNHEKVGSYKIFFTDGGKTMNVNTNFININFRIRNKK